MNIIEFSSPAPSCLVPLNHPAQGRKLNETDVAATFDLYRIDCRDDYDLVQSHDWLELGAFK